MAYILEMPSLASLANLLVPGRDREAEPAEKELFEGLKDLVELNGGTLRAKP